MVLFNSFNHTLLCKMFLFRNVNHVQSKFDYSLNKRLNTIKLSARKTWPSNQISSFSTSSPTPKQVYQKLIDQKQLRPDSNQVLIIEKLDRLFHDLENYKPPIIPDEEAIPKTSRFLDSTLNIQHEGVKVSSLFLSHFHTIEEKVHQKCFSNSNTTINVKPFWH